MSGLVVAGTLRGMYYSSLTVPGIKFCSVAISFHRAAQHQGPLMYVRVSLQIYQIKLHEGRF